ncbi:secondary thiamine-phosphate synthase enzyme YjbQ [Spirochaetia bacterium 38H-sp]|uniref:Secondary thiamine-phosphate synthase enzyme YjbQ n=1 Tax=Rarispira pelagica TaxID=3141764 RepID=A0ABU9U992_9SPIR
MKIVNIRTQSRVEMKNITSHVRNFLREKNIKDGAIIIYSPHTTAGITINEAADPDVIKDMTKELNKIIPFEDQYAHIEGNSAAHIKTSLIGPSVIVPVTSGQLTLGTWQGIFFCEFDGPRNRQFYIKALQG